MNIKGAAAALKAFKEARTGDVVSQEELLRRAAICNAPCPMRKHRKGLGTRVSAALGRLANKNRVPDEIGKYHCGACGCSFMMLLPSKTLHPDTTRERDLRPSTCWVLTAEQQAEKKNEEAIRRGCPTC